MFTRAAVSIACLLAETAEAEDFTQVGGDISNLEINLSLQVSLVDQVNAQYKLQSCNSAGCTDSNIVNVADTSAYLRAAVTQISPDSVEDFSRFGHSIAISADGNRIAVGAPGESGFAAGIHYYSEFTQEDGEGNNESGAAYIFDRKRSIHGP